MDFQNFLFKNMIFKAEPFYTLVDDNDSSRIPASVNVL